MRKLCPADDESLAGDQAKAVTLSECLVYAHTLRMLLVARSRLVSQRQATANTIRGLLKTFGLDDILVCPHDETDRCPCRKPNPGLLVEAAFKWHLDLDRSFVISDKWQDAEAARTAGCTSLLVDSPWLGKVHRDFVLPDLAAVVEKILRLKSTDRVMAA